MQPLPAPHPPVSNAPGARGRFALQAVATRAAQRDAGVGRCLFVDLDVHQGDGTAAIFRDGARPPAPPQRPRPAPPPRIHQPGHPSRLPSALLVRGPAMVLPWTRLTRSLTFRARPPSIWQTRPSSPFQSTAATKVRRRHCVSPALRQLDCNRPSSVLTPRRPFTLRPPRLSPRGASPAATGAVFSSQRARPRPYAGRPSRMHRPKGFPAQLQESDLDVALPAGTGDEEYLEVGCF
jgi:hypothetical protein